MSKEELILSSDGDETKKVFKTSSKTETISKNDHRFYINGGISMDAPWFSELIQCLDTSTEHDTITITMNSYGGETYTAFQVIDMVNKCKAKVILHVSGICASAATIITFGGKYDELYISPISSFLFHSGGTFDWGKPMDVIDNQTFYLERLDYVFRSVYSNILTQSEIKQILNGKELWLGGDQVTDRILENERKRLAVAKRRKERKKRGN